MGNDEQNLLSALDAGAASDAERQLAQAAKALGAEILDKVPEGPHRMNAILALRSVVDRSIQAFRAG